MREEQVARSVLSWLTERGWEILDYDFPGGGTGRSFHVGEFQDKTSGLVIPDVIAIKDSTLLVMENKAKDTRSDYEKIGRLSGSGFERLLHEAYPQRTFDHVVFGIAFSGPSRYAELAEVNGVGVVVQVAEDGRCAIARGNL